jgi:hypothetical protein
MKTQNMKSLSQHIQESFTEFNTTTENIVDKAVGGNKEEKPSE